MSNTAPNFTKQANITSVLITAANTSSQGGGTIGTDIFKVFTADSLNGSYVEYVRFVPTATTPTTTTATVGRLFISSIVSGSTTSSNTYLVAEITLPAIAADNASAAAIYVDISLNIRLPASYTILATNHAAPAASTAWRVTALSAGDY